MGASASLRSIDNIVLNYIKKKSTRNFYNLMLHPVHDRFQQNQFGLTPRGSLLEWIDAFFEYSKSDLDRTAGKLTNVERIVTILDELLLDENLRGKVKLRVFGSETGGPTEHGDFSGIVIPENDQHVIVPVTFKYWLPIFWRENYEEIERCRGRNARLFVKRGKGSDAQTFFVPVEVDEPDLLEMDPAPPNCEAGFG